MTSEGGGAREAKRGRRSKEAGGVRGRGKARLASGQAKPDRGKANGAVANGGGSMLRWRWSERRESKVGQHFIVQCCRWRMQTIRDS